MASEGNASALAGGVALAVTLLFSCTMARAQSAADAGVPSPDAGLAESPFKCVETSPEAEFVVTVAYHGGFAETGAVRSMMLARHGASVTLRASMSMLPGTRLAVSREIAIDATNIASTLAQFREAVARPEVKESCLSDAYASTRVTWCCRTPGKEPESGTLSYSHYGCGLMEPGDPAQRSMPGHDLVRGEWLWLAVHGVLERLLVDDLFWVRFQEVMDEHKAEQGRVRDRLPAPEHADLVADAGPPVPPKAMLAEPCAQGLRLRYSLSRAPEYGHPETAQWMRDCVDADGHPHGRWSEWSHDGRKLRSTIWPEGAVVMPDASFIPPPGWVPRCGMGAVIWNHEWIHPTDGGWEKCRPELPGY